MKNLFALAGLLISSLLVNAQKNYAVMVTDSKTGNPIEGASIKILSTGQTLFTSGSGNVVMLVSSDDSLQIMAKGYKERKLQMTGQFIALSIILDPVPIKKTKKNAGSTRSIKKTGVSGSRLSGKTSTESSHGN